MRRFALALVLVAVAGRARLGHAAPLPPPTVFDGAYQGLVVGATAGLATGYLFAREDGWHTSDWRPLVYGAGIGALAGAAIGLTLGVVDMSEGRPGRNAYVMRDGMYGAGLGAVLGGIAGGLVALSSHRAENVLFGASIGVLAGTCLGMSLGLAEGYRRYAVVVSAVDEPDGRYALLPALAGRF
ncbi:MAG: hypothetical protein ABSB49_12755 [Polyangia bacterium]|jgi:hypothetical protein